MISASTPRNDPSNGVLAAPLRVEGIDDNDLDGVVPRDILTKGTRIVIPRWLDTGANDELMVFWTQNAAETIIFEQSYPAGVIEPFVYVTLTPQQMAIEGVAHVHYLIWKRGGGNPDESPPRKLTIDRTPLLTFPEPLAVHATIWGYLNNNTIPPLTSGATLRIRPLNTIALPGDVALITWRGYRTLNGSGPEVMDAFGRWSKILSDIDITNGFSHVVPFRNHISLLFDNDSAVVGCQLSRGNNMIAESEKGLVKIDQVILGNSSPSGLNTQGETTMGIKFVQKKQRPASSVSSGIGPLADISVDTLTGGFIAKAVLDSGTLPIRFTRPADEVEGDEIDVRYREKGAADWEVYPKTIELGPIADRPIGTIPLLLDAPVFAERPLSPGPTVWELEIDLFKGGGGNWEPSNTLEFTVDQLAPVNTKNPSRKIKPTPALTFVNATPLPDRSINKDWIDNNPDLNFTVSVGYFGRRTDDVLTVWLISGTQKVEFPNITVSATGGFSIPSSALLQFPNGRVNTNYRWDDWLGNLGEESASTPTLTLTLPLAPSITKAPLVPKTDPNYATPIYWEDFLSTTSSPSPIPLPAIVENAIIQNAEPGDEVYLVFTKALDVSVFFETDKQTWANANLSFDTDFTDLYPLFADADNSVDIEIKSVIVRAGLSPDAESPPAIFTFDSRVAGVIPTNPPDLNNPDLQLPVVRGASDVPDVIAATDRDKSGTFTVTNAIADPDILPEHEVKCYLGNATVPFAIFSPLVAVQDFFVTIPAGEMNKLKSPSDTARYTIEITGLGKNVNKSLPKTVVVNQVPVVLPPPTIRIRNPANRDFIECYGMTSPTSNYVLGLQIGKTPLLPEGTLITAHFEAHANATGTQLIPGTKDSKPYTIKAPGLPDVAGVGIAANFKAAQPKRGAVAYGKYWYTAQGESQSSIPIIKPLDTINNSFQYCDQTLVPV